MDIVTFYLNKAVYFDAILIWIPLIWITVWIKPLEIKRNTLLPILTSFMACSWEIYIYFIYDWGHTSGAILRVDLVFILFALAVIDGFAARSLLTVGRNLATGARGKAGLFLVGGLLLYVPAASVAQLAKIIFLGQESALHVAVKSGELQRVKSVIEDGANLESRDSTGDTPLHLSAFKGYTEITKYLLDHGAKVDATNKDKRTP